MLCRTQELAARLYGIQIKPRAPAAAAAAASDDEDDDDEEKEEGVGDEEDGPDGEEEEEEAGAASALPDLAPQRKRHQVLSKGPSAAALAREQAQAAAKLRQQQEQERKQKFDEEQEVWRKRKAEKAAAQAAALDALGAGVDEEEDEGKDGKDEVDVTEGTEHLLATLTAKPADDDFLTNAIPMLAPYSAILDCKYKGKLVPGGGKKTRVVADAMTIFAKVGATKQREVFLMKQVSDTEFVTAVLGNAKISAPGLAAVQQNIKAKKKADAKRRR